jgi:formylglycine-generating enzyme required for sulfatase activity
MAQARVEDLKKQQIAVATPPVAAKPAPATPAQPTAAVSPPARCDGVEALVGSERRCLRPKDSFRDCPDCPEMVVVPAGEFMMGSEENNDEKPAHKVSIAKPLAVGKFEVTFAEWDSCASDGDCKRRPEDRGWGRGNRPVIDVSWNDATKEYLPWLGRKTGKTYRLLTEAEWEYVARAGSSTRYSWGDDIGKAQANCDGCGSQWDNKQTAPVGSFAANAFGLHDLHGNVWEWVADCYKGSYSSAPPDGQSVADSAACSRIFRGGSWSLDPQFLRPPSATEVPRSTAAAVWAFVSPEAYRHEV